MSIPELWQHQKNGIEALSRNPGYLLAYDMGTGKSRVVVEYVRQQGLHRTLIVCPKSVIPVWRDEFDKFIPDDGGSGVTVVLLDTGSSARSLVTLQREISKSDASGTPLVIVVNYESVWRGELTSRTAYTAGLGEAVMKAKWDLVVADESHKIKSPGGRASRFLSRLGSRTPRRVALTGTPMPHSPLDIYGQYRFIDPNVFGYSFVRFRSRYAVMGGFNNRQVVGYQNRQDLRQRVATRATQVRKEDVLADLPSAVHERRLCELGAAGRRMYKQLEKDFVADVNGGVITAANALVRLLRLQQMTSGFYVSDENGEKSTNRVCSSKPDLLGEVLEGISKNEPVVVFCRFREDLNAVRQQAKKAERDYFELSGTDNSLAEWQGDSTGSVIGVQIQSGGVGVNMVRSCYCVFYSLGFSMGDYEQAQARVHRAGQTRPVTYIHLVSKGTVDLKVYSSMGKKADAVSSILSEIQMNNKSQEVLNDAF